MDSETEMIISIISDAENDDPFAMYELARLYDLDVIPDSSESKYIYWFKRFWNTEVVQRILAALESENDIDTGVSIPDEMVLRDYITESGLALCFYYMNSTDALEVSEALEYATGAWGAAGCPSFLEDDSDGETDMVSLMKKLSERLVELGVEPDVE